VPLLYRLGRQQYLAIPNQAGLLLLLHSCSYLLLHDLDGPVHMLLPYLTTLATAMLEPGEALRLWEPPVVRNVRQ
jgi:hypothetical protein